MLEKVEVLNKLLALEMVASGEMTAAASDSEVALRNLEVKSRWNGTMVTVEK